jgi:hypothetical protein
MTYRRGARSAIIFGCGAWTAPGSGSTRPCATVCVGSWDATSRRARPSSTASRSRSLGRRRARQRRRQDAQRPEAAPAGRYPRTGAPRQGAPVRPPGSSGRVAGGGGHSGLLPAHRAPVGRSGLQCHGQDLDRVASGPVGGDRASPAEAPRHLGADRRGHLLGRDPPQGLPRRPSTEVDHRDNPITMPVRAGIRLDSFIVNYILSSEFRVTLESLGLVATTSVLVCQRERSSSPIDRR